ncbi:MULTISPECIES: DeoR/GlpR family DNA-binding transcription regulator [Nocardioides]|uniref:DeoR/GlpR family DNA-binding transcription regulator n=1 Tax=Nocardioides vastitatis TaxID=2568655 RepID=A0ABW0ZH27_9ACTN|nr:DeoR/GlpR family DNA-binding transcription regulator [Nocardioides sp.]THI94072.1 DeoR/GlpR transcriptional regulator [Nocardioides sp.]
MTADATVRRATRERHDAIVGLVREGVDGVELLAERLGVSASTVRRDLSQLQRQGRIARTYGGALVPEVFHERPFTESELINRAAKTAIGRVAVDMVPPEGTVFVDAGTTCLALAELLVGRGPLTVVTRGLEAAVLLARAPLVEVVMTGGRVQPLSHGVVGPLASLALDRLHFDVAFLGADAVDAERGLGEPTVEETWVKEQAAARADQVAVLADSSKLGQHAPAWVAIESTWTLVTDAAAPVDEVERIRARGVRVRTS